MTTPIECRVPRGGTRANSRRRLTTGRAIRRIPVMFGAAAVLGVVILRAQQTPAPTFRAGIDIVHVDVSVLDRDRKPVRGLTAADFTVLEDGTPRPIVAFSAVDLPGPSAAPDPGAPQAAWVIDEPADVATNHIAAEGRLVTIVFDWSIRFADQPLARRIARAAVENLGALDLAAVVFTSGFSNAGTSQGFTSDKGRLLEVITRPMTPAREGIDADLLARSFQDRQPYPWLFDPDGAQSGDCLCRVCVFDKVGDVADAMAGIPGRRKTMVFIGTYFPSPSSNPASPCRDHVRVARDAATEKLNLANVTVHVIDPAGTAGPDDGPLPIDDATAKAAGWPHSAGLGGEYLTERFRAERLPFLADLTGGRTVMNANGSEAAVPAILGETSSYYVLAFQSADDGRRPGRAHKLEVQVTRRDVALQHRKTYQAGQTTTALEAEARKLPLVRAIEPTLPRTDRPLIVSATPFAIRGRQEAPVAVVLRFEPPATMPIAASAAPGVRPRDEAAVVIAALDPQGKVVGTVSQKATVPWAPGGSGPVAYELLSRLELKPGRYEIRAASDFASGERTSVYGTIDVPDFGSARLSMSGIVIEALPGGTSAPKDAFTTGSFASIPLPLIPTARRAFDSTDRVRAFVRVYQQRSGGAAPAVAARILDASGAVRFGADLAATESGYEIDLPFERLSPGEHLLRIDAASGDDKASRSVRFTMR